MPSSAFSSVPGKPAVEISHDLRSQVDLTATQGPPIATLALLKRLMSRAASTKHRLSNENCLHCSTAPLLLKAETLQPNCHSPTPFQLIAKGWALCPKCSRRRQRCSVQIVLHSTCCFLAGCFQNCNPRNRLLQENAQKIFRHVSCLEEVSIQSLPKCKDPK